MNRPLVLSYTEMYGVLTSQEQLYRDYATGLWVKQYLNIGSELLSKYPQSTLMTSEIGGLGWSFSGRIIDAAGLVSPDCLKYHPMSIPNQRHSGDIGAIPPQAVIEKQPDLIVSMDIFSEALRRDINSGQIQNYEQFKVYPALDNTLAHDPNLVLWDSPWTRIYIKHLIA